MTDKSETYNIKKFTTISLIKNLTKIMFLSMHFFVQIFWPLIRINLTFRKVIVKPSDVGKSAAENKEPISDEEKSEQEDSET